MTAKDPNGGWIEKVQAMDAPELLDLVIENPDFRNSPGFAAIGSAINERYETLTGEKLTWEKIQERIEA